jgi:hypothetical protein
MGPNRETDRIGLSMMLVFEERRSSRHRRQLCPRSRSLLMVGLSDCVGKEESVYGLWMGRDAVECKSFENSQGMKYMFKTRHTRSFMEATTTPPQKHSP